MSTLTLTFTKGIFKDKVLWEATFTASADFNLHLERPTAGLLVAQQRTTEAGEYANVSEFNGQDFKNVIDATFIHDGFPKSIKILSENQPTMAVVTFKE